MASDLAALIVDPQFQKLGGADQRAVLSRATGDNSFAGLNDADTQEYISRASDRIRLTRPDLAGAPGGISAPKINMQSGPEGLEADPNRPAHAWAGVPGAQPMNRPVRGRDLVPGAVVAAPAAAYMGGANVLPFLTTAAKTHPVITQMVASEAISQARKIPGVGKFIPPYSEWLPFLLGGAHGAVKGKTAPPEPVYPGAPEPGGPPDLSYPGAPEPTATTEQLNPALTSKARSMPGQISAERIYGPRPKPAQPIPARQGLMLSGEVAQPAPEPAPAERPSQLPWNPPVSAEPAPQAAQPKPAPRVSGKQLQDQIERGLGNEQPMEVQRGVPIGKQRLPFLPQQPAQQFAPQGNVMDQIKASAEQPATQNFSPTADLTQQIQNSPETLPAGHTAVDSQKIRSQMYDPKTQELHVTYRTSPGTVYAYKGVSPEQYQYFLDADSKGQALRAIESSSPYDKIQDGQRIQVRTDAGVQKQIKQSAARQSQPAKPSASSSSSSSSNANSEDLSSSWSKNNAYLRSRKK